MATFYPGVKARMGRWTYYLIRMSMNDLKQVKFAYEVEESNALGETLQRTLNESRASGQIADYIQRQPDRFFNSIVIASLADEVTWIPITISDSPNLQYLITEAEMEAFGLLRLSGDESYFAIDGQHRLAAIQEMLRPGSPRYQDRPEGFEREQISVVLVTPGEAETPSEFKERFRRLFGNLNRYAKPMDNATTIIMEEDDALAIVTRLLFSRHEFFKTVGPERESKIVDTTKGKNISNPRQPHLTKLEVLYEMNTVLLESNERKNNGWAGTEDKTSEFIRFRPSDEIIDELYSELATYWDAILEVLPFLKSEAAKMRNHAVIDNEERGDEQDNLLFWPIGQMILAKCVRYLLDFNEVTPGQFEEAVKAIEALRNMPWDLDMPPWRNFLLIPNALQDKWVMPSANREQLKNVAVSMITTFATEGSNVDEITLEALKEAWKSLLLPALEDDYADEMWQIGISRFGL